MSRLFKHIRDTLIMAAVTLALLEPGLRALGHHPYHFPKFSISSVPKGALIPHPSRGLALNPGQYRVTLNKQLEYTATHSPDSLRTTGPAKQPGEEILLYGCSFTYGMGVDDSLTFAHLLQARLPHTRITNAAVPGHGSIQGYLDLRDRLQDKARKRPHTVIMLYASFHDERNALTPHYCEHLHYGFLQSDAEVRERFGAERGRMPHARLQGGGLVFHHTPFGELFQPLPLREYSAIANLIQEGINQRQARKLQAAKVTETLLLQMDALCQANGIEFLVASVVKDGATRQMLKRLREQGLSTLDMGLDIIRNPKYNNQPHDSHPNAVAHAVYAERLYFYLNGDGVY